MAELILYHHAHGLTDGVRAFAELLQERGHVVHLPDLYDGRRFDDLEDGVRFAQEEIGFEQILDRGRRAAEDLPHDLVYAGFSLGVMPAQMLTQTRPGARGAVFLHSAVPVVEFGAPWPEGVPLQMHTMEDDEWGDMDVAEDLAAIPGAELFRYPGDRHLFTDRSLPAYDSEATALVVQRVLRFLDGGLGQAALLR